MQKLFAWSLKASHNELARDDFFQKPTWTWLFQKNLLKTIVLPLGYPGCHNKPCSDKKCDLPKCKTSDTKEDWKIFHGCFHSFHILCLNESTSCPLCKDFLQKQIKELGEIATRQAILNLATCSVYTSSKYATATTPNKAYIRAQNNGRFVCFPIEF